MSEDTLFRGLAAVLTATMIGISIYFRHRADQTGGRVGRHEETAPVRVGLSLSGLLGFGGLLAYFFWPTLLAPTMLAVPVWARWVGVALLAASTLATWWIFRALGANVTRTVLTREGATLVTTGPYRFVRHPLYTNGALAFTALSLLTTSWWFLGAVAIGISLLAVRTRQEEAHLAARFGAAWSAYAATTGRFLPRLRPAAPARIPVR
jgi:protein-S-isoprenylcysteine O-methyltransferase Ste14